VHDHPVVGFLELDSSPSYAMHPSSHLALCSVGSKELSRMKGEESDVDDVGIADK
jgi:hypothetical protein